MSGKSLIRQEEALIVEPQRVGSVLMTAGKLLLWMDLLIFVYVPIGLREGSRMWLWWGLGQGIAGLVLLAIGVHRRGGLTDKA